jgi:hypothetical protein
MATWYYTNRRNSAGQEEKMNKRCIFSCACACAVALITAAIPAQIYAQEPIVFPSRGQSREQMEQDRFTCYQWARDRTGFDPMQVPTMTAPMPQQRGGVVSGAAGGALAGVAIGAIAGNAGQGAAIGAASGGMIGGMRSQNSRQEQDRFVQQQQASFAQRRAEYNRAWAACMEGKGYTVR